MNSPLAPLIDQWIDGTLDEEGARALASALADEDARKDILDTLKMHGLLTKRSLCADEDGIVRSVMERLHAEERADQFIAEFWRNNGRTELGTAGTLNPRTKTNVTVAAPPRRTRHLWVAAAAACLGTLGFSLWPRTREPQPAYTQVDEPSQAHTRPAQGPTRSHVGHLQLSDGSLVFLKDKAEAFRQRDGTRLLLRGGAVRVAFAETPKPIAPAARVVFPDGSELEGPAAIVDLVVDDSGLSASALAGVAWVFRGQGVPPVEVAVGKPATFALNSPRPRQDVGHPPSEGSRPTSSQALRTGQAATAISFSEQRGDGRWSRTQGWIQQSEVSQEPGRHDRAPIWKGPIDLPVPFALETVVVADRPAQEGFFTLGLLLFWQDAPMIGCHLVGRAGGGRVVRLEALQSGAAAPPFATMEEFPWQPVSLARGDAYQLRFEAEATGTLGGNGRPLIRMRCQAWPVEEAAAPMEWGAVAEVELGARLKAIGLRTYRTAGRFSELVFSASPAR